VRDGRRPEVEVAVVVEVEQSRPGDPENLVIEIARRGECEVSLPVAQQRVARVLRIGGARVDLVGWTQNDVDVTVTVEIAHVRDTPAAVVRAVPRREQT
jgi:hypothetical protein